MSIIYKGNKILGVRGTGSSSGGSGELPTNPSFDSVNVNSVVDTDTLYANNIEVGDSTIIDGESVATQKVSVGTTVSITPSSAKLPAIISSKYRSSTGSAIMYHVETDTYGCDGVVEVGDINNQMIIKSAAQPLWNNGNETKELLIMEDLYQRKEMRNIPSGADLNTIEYLTPGIYAGNGNSITNSPTTGAFIMEVFSYGLPPNDNEQTETWVYRLRKITDYSGNMYIQSCNSGSTAGTFIYGAWRSTLNNSSGGTSTPTGYPISDTVSYLSTDTLESNLEGLVYDSPENGIISYECTSNKGIRFRKDSNLQMQETFCFLMHDKPIYFDTDTTFNESVNFEFDCMYDDILGIGIVFVGFSSEEKSVFNTSIDGYCVNDGTAYISFYDIVIPENTLIRYDKYSNIIYIENCVYGEC